MIVKQHIPSGHLSHRASIAMLKNLKTGSGSDHLQTFNKSHPIGSMYAIYSNIYHQYIPFMLAYIPYMDPMGMACAVK